MDNIYFHFVSKRKNQLLILMQHKCQTFVPICCLDVLLCTCCIIPSDLCHSYSLLIATTEKQIEPWLCCSIVHHAAVLG